jgi:hypothetical protein
MPQFPPPGERLDFGDLRLFPNKPGNTFKVPKIHAYVPAHVFDTTSVDEGCAFTVGCFIPDAYDKRIAVVFQLPTLFVALSLTITCLMHEPASIPINKEKAGNYASMLTGKRLPGVFCADV